MKLPTPALAAVITIAALGPTGCASAAESAASASAGAPSTACPWEGDESVTGPVRLGHQVLPSGDLVVKDRGVLEACMPNADITWTQYASGGDVVQAFGAGSLDLGTAGSSPTVRALSAPLDLDVQVVWVQDVIGDGEALVAKDAGATGVEDLVGARIGVPFSSTAHFSLLAALRDAGLDPATDVQVINLAPDAILGAWQGDQVDAAYIWDPTLSELLADGTQIVSGLDVSAAGAPTFDLSAATTDFVDANPAFMEQWTRAQDWAVQLILEDPAAAAESIAAEMGTETAVVEDQLAGTTYLRAADQQSQYFGGPLGPVLADTAAFLAAEGQIDGALPAQEYTAALHTDSIAAVTAS